MFDAVKNMLEGKKRQHRLDIVEPAPDLLILDPAKIDDGEEKVGSDRKKLPGRHQHVGEPSGEGPGALAMVEENGKKRAERPPLLPLPNP